MVLTNTAGLDLLLAQACSRHLYIFSGAGEMGRGHLVSQVGFLWLLSSTGPWF